MALTVQVKTCPVCRGEGTLDPSDRLPKAKQLIVCANCRGHGDVPLLTCRGCGRPAIQWDDPVVPYCGRKDCYDKLVEVIDLAKKPREVTVFRPKGFLGGYMADRGWSDFNDGESRNIRELTPQEEARFLHLVRLGGHC